MQPATRAYPGTIPIGTDQQSSPAHTHPFRTSHHQSGFVSHVDTTTATHTGCSAATARIVVTKWPRSALVRQLLGRLASGELISRAVAVLFVGAQSVTHQQLRPGNAAGTQVNTSWHVFGREELRACAAVHCVRYSCF